MDEPENIQHLREVYAIDEMDNEFPEELIQSSVDKVPETGYFMLSFSFKN